MPPSALQCPKVGHKTFEKSLASITLGDADTPQQISKFVRPHACTNDEMNMEFAPGELQKSDLAIALSMFSHRHFILNTFEKHRELFRHSACCIYQFQTITKSDDTFVFGLFITDGGRNLIDFCVDTHLAHKRRPVLQRIIRALCTPASVSHRLDH